MRSVLNLIPHQSGRLAIRGMRVRGFRVDEIRNLARAQHHAAYIRRVAGASAFMNRRMSASFEREAPASSVTGSPPTAARKRRIVSSTGRMESITYPGEARLTESWRAILVESARAESAAIFRSRSSLLGRQPTAVMIAPRNRSRMRFIDLNDEEMGISQSE